MSRSGIILPWSLKLYPVEDVDRPRIVYRFNEYNQPEIVPRKHDEQDYGFPVKDHITVFDEYKDKGVEAKFYFNGSVLEPLAADKPPCCFIVEWFDVLERFVGSYTLLRPDGSTMQIRHGESPSLNEFSTYENGLCHFNRRVKNHKDKVSNAIKKGHYGIP